jgi:hypothetical protein
MRFAMPLCFSVIAAAVLAGPAHSEGADDSLRIYAVHIVRTPKESWTGIGVYLGRGIVITAAHVAGLGIWRRPRVEIDGQDLPTDVLKDGHFQSVDLTLLSVDVRQLPVSLGLRRMPLCQKSPWVGEPVIVATPEGVGRSYVMSPTQLPPGIPAQYQTVIRYVAGTGDSGSGVFDANKKCLLGIITRKISGNQIRQENGDDVKEQHDVAKYFVPASTIADFIPPDVRSPE